MTSLSIELAETLADACKAGAVDAAASLSSALDNTMQVVDVTGGAPLGASDLPADLEGPGLAISFQVGDEGIALLLPEATNLLPPWYVEPDATGESKLQTLAQELSLLLLPEDCASGNFAAIAVGNLSAAMTSAQLAEPAGCVQLSLTGDDGKGAFYLLWPLGKSDVLLSAQSSVQQSEIRDKSTNSQIEPSAHPSDGSEALPQYSRSLLSIHVPVVVNLAETKMTVDSVVHLGPGSIIQFTKSCDEMLDLEAGEHKIAEGEAVKVGDKFGLRITSIRLPEERLLAIGQ